MALFYFFNDSNHGISYSGNNLLEKIENIDDLDKDIIWWSNKNDKGLPLHIKQSGFLLMDFNDVCNIFGLEKEDSIRLVKELFGLFNSVVENINIKEVDLLNSKTIAEAKSKAVRFDKLKEINDINIENFSLLDLLNTDENGFTGDIKVSKIDYIYYRVLCKRSYPVGDWVSMDKRQLEKIKKVDIDYFERIAKKKNILIKVKIKRENLVSNFLNRLDGEFWLTGKEYLFLKKFYDLSIIKLMVSRKNLKLEYIENNKLFKNVGKINFSDSVAALNYIFSFISGDNKFWLTFWLRREMELNIIKGAYVFHNIGCNVINISKFDMSMNYENSVENKKMIIDTALRAGFIFDVNNIKHLNS